MWLDEVSRKGSGFARPRGPRGRSRQRTRNAQRQEVPRRRPNDKSPLSSHPSGAKLRGELTPVWGGESSNPSLWCLGRARCRPAPSTVESLYAASMQTSKSQDSKQVDFSSVTIVVRSPKPFPWPPPVIMTNLPNDDLGACKCSRHCSSRSFLADMWLWLQCRRRAARRASRKVTLKNL